MMETEGFEGKLWEWILQVAGGKLPNGKPLLLNFDQVALPYLSLHPTPTFFFFNFILCWSIPD